MKKFYKLFCYLHVNRHILNMTFGIYKWIRTIDIERMYNTVTYNN